MNHLFSRGTLFTLISAILYGVALNLVQFYLAWICLVPFFISIIGTEKKVSFFQGALFGFVFCCVIYYWMPGAILTISGKSVIGAVLVSLLVPAIMSVYFGLLSICFSVLKSERKAIWTNALLMASIWTIGSFLLSVFFSGMPWFSYDIGNAILSNLYATQPASFGGIHLLNFVVVFINFLFAYFIQQRQWKKTLIPASLILVYLSVGFGILSVFKSQVIASGKQVSVALISGNIPQEKKWDEGNGDFLAKHLLALNNRALNTDPDIILWPEGFVPWTYRADDDLLKEVLRRSLPHNDVCHIMGLETEDGSNLYNSAYCILPDGTVKGRHDKHFLVAMAERPLSLFSSSILKSAEGRNYFRQGEDNGVIATAYGKIGVLICSELYVPQATRKCVDNGAEILVSLSDDVLFAKAPGIVNHQFFKNRLRAVEARKDIAVSCNMGISGMIAATGEIKGFNNDQAEGYTETVVLTPNSYSSTGYIFSIFVLCISGVLILLFCFFNQLNQRIL